MPDLYGYGYGKRKAKPKAKRRDLRSKPRRASSKSAKERKRA